MKRVLISIVLVILCTMFCTTSSAAGFTTNADAIEAAADSVLMIGAFDEKNTDVFSRGSGFVAFNSSTLVTNYHVIDGATDVVAMDDDDNFYEIKYVLCADKDFDIAILEFSEPTGLKPLDLYASENLKRGSPVVTIGSPGGGYKNTVTAGVVSSQMLREDGVPEIQFSAPISSGNSGGALLNDDGQVIGVTTETYVKGQNINFAVNISVAKAMYKAWDGTKYALRNYKSKAKMDFDGVYEQSVQPAVSSVVTEPPAEQVSSLTESWTCLNCGHENTTRFCQECGAEKPYWVCSCGRTNSSSKFCGDCGKSLAEQIDSLNSAIAEASQHKYSEAITTLESLGQFDSGSFETSDGAHIAAKSYIPKLYYDQGVYLQANNGSHEEIIASFEKAGDYGDAKEQLQGENARYLKAFYDAGVEHFENAEYEAAVEAFTTAGNYQDAKDKIKEVYYSQGLDLLEKKEYEASRDALRKAGIYKDASDVINKTFYLEAIDLMGKKEYDKALVRLNNASGYSDSKEKIKEIYYLQAEDALAAGNNEMAMDLFMKAGDYRDAESKIEQIKEAGNEKIYQLGIAAFNTGNYDLAAKRFESITDYRDANEQARKTRLAAFQQSFDEINSNPETMTDSDMKKLEGLLGSKYVVKEDPENKELCNRIKYIIAQFCYNKLNYEQAISWFKDAGDYLDAKERIIPCRVSKITHLIELDKLTDAVDYYDSYRNELNSAGIGDFVIIEPGLQGAAVNEILRLLIPLGNKIKLAADENLYKEEYTDPIKKLEEHFGFESDGKITINEFSKLHSAVYAGCDLPVRCRSLVEKLADLLYLSNLPKEHNSYEGKYINGVKKAETDLGLLVDGIITREEYDKIMEQKVDMTAPAQLKVQVKNDTATLTWQKVQGALSYEVSCDGKVLGTTEKTTWVQKTIQTGTYLNFSVKAKKYTVTTFPRSNSQYVKPFYISVNAKELNSNRSSYAGKYVKISGLSLSRFSISSPDGSTSNSSNAIYNAQTRNNYDVHLVCKSGNNFVELIIEDYKGWDWNNTNDDLLGSIKKVKSISGQGVVKDGFFSSISSRPIIILNHISWSW